MPARPLLAALAAAALLCAAAPVSGKEINWSAIRAVSRKGPWTATLKDGKAFVRIPSNYRLVTEDKLADYHELMGDAPIPDEVGVLLPEEGGWTATVILPKEDPLKDQDPKVFTEKDPDARKPLEKTLMAWNEKALADGQPKRLSLSLPPLKITGWTHKPAYDADKKRLVMGLRVSEENDRANGKKDELYYKTLIYGPDGAVVLLQTMAAIGSSYDKPVDETKKLAGEVGFPTADGPAGDDEFYYYKVGGAAFAGVFVVFVVGWLVTNRGAQSAVQSRPAARRFGGQR